MSDVDPEQALNLWLAAQFPAARVVTEMPAAIVDPTIRVLGLGGTNDFVLDKALVTIDCLAPSRIEARELAKAVKRAIVESLPGKSVQGGYVSRVKCTSLPAWRPYDNTKVRRFGATYQIFCR